MNSINQGAVKPHMQRRPGETLDEWRSRLAHSCYRCGTRYADKTMLDVHEQHCQGHSGQAGVHGDHAKTSSGLDNIGIDELRR